MSKSQIHIETQYKRKLERDYKAEVQTGLNEVGLQIRAILLIFYYNLRL
jgi:hypothetical protein